MPTLTSIILTTVPAPAKAPAANARPPHMLAAIIDPFEFAFMQRAFLAACLAALVCSVVGTFVVLRGMAFMGDAVAHLSGADDGDCADALDHGAILTRVSRKRRLKFLGMR